LRLDSDGEFFVQLADQRRRFALARLDAAARKAKRTGRGDSLGASDHQ